MNNFVSFNRQAIPFEKAKIPAVSAAALYGRGVFTSLAVHDAKPFLWDKHWRRLQDNAARTGVDLGEFEEAAVCEALFELINKNNLEEGRARLSFFAEAPGKIWSAASGNKTSLLITSGEFNQRKDEFLLTVSPFPVNSKSPLAGVKSCNYMENLLASEEAQRRGFDEAVRLNERGEVVSGALANLFWVKEAVIFTPALETGCLAGTTREFLTENFPVRETKAKIEALFEADEIFLTSAGIGICRVRFAKAERKATPVLPKLLDFFESFKVKP
jgi:branched-subunit amino acid aminotransferase/4-amino-4-deoxychorismate lyase